MRTRHNVLLWAFCGCSMLVWAGTRSWGFEQPGEKPVGITGLIPEVAPDGLSADQFSGIAESIGDNWRPWVEETAEIVKEFYEGDHPTIAEQRAVLQKLRVKLKTMETALGDRRYRSIHATLADLHGVLAPQVELAEAALDTLTADAEETRRRLLPPAFERLQSAISALRKDMRDFQGGGRWLTWINADQLSRLNASTADWQATVAAAKSKLEKRETHGDEIRQFLSRESFLELEDALGHLQTVASPPPVADDARLRALLGELLTAVTAHQKESSSELDAKIRGLFEEIRQIAPDQGAALSTALQAHLFNFNLRLIVSEGLLNRFVSDTRRETSPVRERMMEAYISGHQWTTTSVSLDLKPSSRDARFNLVLDGTVQSSTTGFAEQATVQTVGRHTFRAEKPVIFNGEEFQTQAATVSARANNQTVAATTRYRMPIIKGIAQNIAMREAQARTPQANALAAQRIRSRVSGQLDEEVDQQFANASMDLQAKRYGPLREQGLFPDEMSVSSTERELNYWTRLMASGESGGSRPVPTPSVPSNGLVAQIHESLMNNGMERFELNGKTMTEAEARAHLEDRFSKLLGREVKFDEKEPTEEPEAVETRLVFAARDAVRFSVRNGEVTLIIRAGLQREGMDDIPEQIITVPFAVRLAGDQLVLDRGNVGVRPVERAPSVAAQVTRANVMRQKIQSALPERTVDATYDIEQQNRKVTLRITDITASGGWLSLTLQ